MKNPLCCLVVCFCLGTIYVYLFKIPFWPYYIVGAVLIAIGAFMLNQRLGFDILFLAVIFISGALSLKNAYTISKADISRYAYNRNDTVYALKGFINSRPVIKDGGVSFIFRAEEVQFGNNSYKTCGDVFVYAKGQNNLSYGDILLLLGSLYKPYRLYKGKAFVAMRIKNNSALVALNKNKGSLFKKLAFYFKDKMELIFRQRLSPLAASINNAMILGEKKRIPAAVYDYMIKTGTVHIMVVSGFHVGVIAFVAGILLKILRIPRRIRYFGIVFCLIMYCFISGASTPAVRATVMSIFLIAGYFFQREPDIVNSLSLAALFIMVINPKDLFSISFQLSFISVFSITYLFPRLKLLFRLEKIRIKFLSGVLDSFLISLAAWVGTSGFIAYYFKIFSPVAVLANIFIVPIASLVILSGLSMLIVSVLLPPLGGAFAAFNEVSVFMLLTLNLFFSNLPFAYYFF